MKPSSPGLGKSANRMPQTHEPRVGDVVLGAFELLEELGSGAYATVYLANQLGTDRKAVVKVPHRHLLEGDQGDVVRARFAGELRAFSRVNHPNVAMVYIAGATHGSLPVIAMEYVPGRSLGAVLAARSPLRAPSIANLAHQMASALAAIHAADIVHRDVTPGNVIASRTAEGRERYVLLDFGVARLKNSPMHTAGPLGTPRYMPKEQVYGRAVPASDMFALGAILWWALTGQQYLDEIEEIPALLLHQASMAAPPDPREVKSSIPDPVARAVSELMHSEAGERPTARQFLRTWPCVVKEWAEVLDRTKQARSAASRPRISIPDESDAADTQPMELPPVHDEPDTQIEAVEYQLSGTSSLRTTVLLVATNPVRRSALRQSLAQLSCDVIECEPAQAVLVAARNAVNLVLVSQSVPEGDGLAVIRQLRGQFDEYTRPTMTLVTTSDMPLASWQEVADHCVVFPGQVRVLQRIVQSINPAGGPPRVETASGVLPFSSLAWMQELGDETLTATIEQFAGAMPEWLEDLREAMARSDSRAAARASRKIADGALVIAADHLVRLAEILAQLAEHDLLDQAGGYPDQIEREFNRVFRELLSLTRSGK